MTKFLLVLLSFFALCDSCYAQKLELSDVIREAREIEMKKSLLDEEQKNMIQPVKNQTEKADIKENSLKMQSFSENLEKNLEDRVNVKEIKN